MSQRVIDWEQLSPFTSGNRSLSWWGTVHLIVTEAMLFACLLFAYFFIRAQHEVWPLGGIKEPELRLVSIMTVLLLSSSLPMYLAERGIKAGRQMQLRIGLAAGFVLASIFLGMQFGMEYPAKEFTPRTNAYGALFFTITGLHALHVIGGLTINLVVQIAAWRGTFDEYRYAAVENASLYWHFVDGVWVFVLISIYLSPRFL